MDDERRGTKRDRAARMTRLIQVMRAHPNGITPDELADRVGMSRRTVYRDLKSIEEELEVALWAEGGR